MAGRGGGRQQLLTTAGTSAGRQHVINQGGISPRSPCLTKNATRRVMTTGEENLVFTSHLKVGMQNRKQTKEKKKKKKPASPKAFFLFFPLSCKALDCLAVLPPLVAGPLVGFAEQQLEGTPECSGGVRGTRSSTTSLLQHCTMQLGWGKKKSKATKSC